MAFRRLTIFAAFLVWSLLAAGEPIRLDQPPPGWLPILESLGSGQPVRCQFEELRKNPFHKLPRRFEGRMWWHPGIGLSLYYEQPSQLIVNILPEGVLMGRPGEEMKPMPGRDQQEVMVLFSRLFSWDVDWLATHFSAEGSLLGDGEWKLSLRPEDETLSRALTRIDLAGGHGVLQSIFLDLHGGRTVEIRLSAQYRGPDLETKELKHAFPNLHED